MPKMAGVGIHFFLAIPNPDLERRKTDYLKEERKSALANGVVRAVGLPGDIVYILSVS